MQRVLNHAPPTSKRKLFQPGAEAKFLQAERGTYRLAPQPTGSTSFMSTFTLVSVGHEPPHFPALIMAEGYFSRSLLKEKNPPPLCNTNLLYRTANTFVSSGVNIYPPANISLLGVSLRAVKPFWIFSSHPESIWTHCELD